MQGSTNRGRSRRRHRNADADAGRGPGCWNALSRHGRKKSWLKLRYMPKSPDPSSTFPSRSNAKSNFHCSLSVPCSYIACQVFFFFFLHFFFSLADTLFQVSLICLTHAPFAVLPQAPSICLCPSTACVSFFFFVVLPLLTLVSERCPIPLCTSLLFVDIACCTCPRLDLCVSLLFFFCFTFAYSPHATSLPPSCHFPPSLMLCPSLCAASFPPCRILPSMLRPSLLPHPCHVPASSRVPASSHIPASSRVPASSHIPASSRVPASSHVPASSYVLPSSHTPPVSFPPPASLPHPSLLPHPSCVPTPTRCTLHQPPFPRRTSFIDVSTPGICASHFCINPWPWLLLAASPQPWPHYLYSRLDIMYL
jgi:hypothetical protein